MKTPKKHLSTAIAIALTLILMAPLITTLPVGYSQLAQEKIGMTADTYVLPQGAYNGSIRAVVGINQNVSITGILYPRPIISGDVYKNVTFRITRPNGTQFYFFKDTNVHAEVDYFDITMDQLGTWSVRMSWDGDDLHDSVTGSSDSWIVQEDSVPLQGPVKTQCSVATVPYTYSGVGQPVYIIGWVNPPRELTGAIYYDIEFTVTKPDGRTETHVEDTASEATASYTIICSQEGTYNVVMKYSGDRFHKASESPPWEWTVGQEQVSPFPDEPLPTGEWKPPVSAEYYEWYQLTGAWPNEWYDAAGSNFNPYTKAPNTPHILWTQQMTAAGMVGQLGWSGRTGGTPSFIAAMGRLWYTTSTGGVADIPTHPVLHCLDQYTGEEIYSVDLPGTGSGSDFALEISPRVKIDPKIAVSEPGRFSLWVAGGSLWEVNPWTGETSWTLQGNYGYSGDAGVLLDDGYIYISNYPSSGYTSKFDCQTKEIVWSQRGISFSCIEGGIIATEARPTGGIPENAYIRSWNATTGEPLAEGVGINNPVSAYNPQRWVTMGDGNMFCGGDDRRMRAVSATTGKTVWTSEPADYPWGCYYTYSGAYAYHNYYEGNWDGYMYCFNGATGDIEWRFFLGNTTETAMGHLVAWGRPLVADGKVYFAASQHTPPTPIPRDHKLFCVDAFTGELIWELPFYSGGGGVSNGMFWSSNQYDGSVYMFGKGETRTTVSVPSTTVALGTNVLIQGTVTDQSPGAKDTPAIADENMGEWMQYIYQNKPMPSDAVGVPVKLCAIASDGSVLDIATVISDSMGHYEYAWAPPDEGTYKIIAAFEGSESYWMSSEQAGLSVGSAPEAPAPPEAAPDSTPYVIGMGVAIIIVVAIVGVLLLRRRP